MRGRPSVTTPGHMHTFRTYLYYDSFDLHTIRPTRMRLVRLTSDPHATRSTASDPHATRSTASDPYTTRLTASNLHATRSTRMLDAWYFAARQTQWIRARQTLPHWG